MGPDKRSAIVVRVLRRIIVPMAADKWYRAVEDYLVGMSPSLDGYQMTSGHFDEAVLDLLRMGLVFETRKLEQGSIPVYEAVRTEEMVETERFQDQRELDELTEGYIESND